MLLELLFFVTAALELVLRSVFMEDKKSCAVARGLPKCLLGLRVLCCKSHRACPVTLSLSLPAHPLQNGGDTNYVVDMDETKLDTEDGILTNDVRGVVRPALKELKIAIMRRTQEFRQVCGTVSSSEYGICLPYSNIFGVLLY